MGWLEETLKSAPFIGPLTQSMGDVAMPMMEMYAKSQAMDQMMANPAAMQQMMQPQMAGPQMNTPHPYIAGPAGADTSSFSTGAASTSTQSSTNAAPKFERWKMDQESQEAFVRSPEEAAGLVLRKYQVAPDSPITQQYLSGIRQKSEAWWVAQPPQNQTPDKFYNFLHGLLLGTMEQNGVKP